MSTPAYALAAREPLPLIQRRYKPVRSTSQGRLSACADGLGTLDLQFDARRRRGVRRATALVSEWRAGPIRSSNLVIEALCQGLVLLGETPSFDGALELSRRIDRDLYTRLGCYLQITAGDYTALYTHVRFADETPAPGGSSQPSPISWVAASTALPGPVRETFLLARRSKAWELWMRSERAASGSMPGRKHACLCSTALLYEEPALAAELLVYAWFRRTGLPVRLDAPPAGLIATDRLRLIETHLAGAH